MLGARRIHAAERQQTGGPAHTPPVMAVTPPCSSAVVRANPARPRGPGLAMREPVILRQSGGKRRCVQMAERRLAAAAGGGHGSQRAGPGGEQRDERRAPRSALPGTDCC